MKSIFTVSIVLIFCISNPTLAQTVSGSPGTTGCLGGGTITASNITAWTCLPISIAKNNFVISPIPDDPINLRLILLFEALSTGTYTLKGRNKSAGTIFSTAKLAIQTVIYRPSF